MASWQGNTAQTFSPPLHTAHESARRCCTPGGCRLSLVQIPLCHAGMAVSDSSSQLHAAAPAIPGHKTPARQTEEIPQVTERSQQPQGHTGTSLLTCVSAVSTLILCVETNRSTSVMGWDSPSGACRAKQPNEVTAGSLPCSKVLPSTHKRSGRAPPCTLILSTASCACAMRTLVGGFLSETSCVEPRYFAPKITPSSRSSGSQGPGTERLGGLKQGLVSSCHLLAVLLYVRKWLSTCEMCFWHHGGTNADPWAAPLPLESPPGLPLLPLESTPFSLPKPGRSTGSLKHPHAQQCTNYEHTSHPTSAATFPNKWQQCLCPGRLFWVQNWTPPCTPMLMSEQAAVGEDPWFKQRNNSPSLKAREEEGDSLFCKAKEG